MDGGLGHRIPLRWAPWNARCVIALRADHNEVLIREPRMYALGPNSSVVGKSAAAQQEGVRHLWGEGALRESYLHRWDQVINVGLMMGDPLPGEQVWLTGDIYLRWGRRPWVQSGSPQFRKQVKLWERVHRSPLQRALGSLVSIQICVSLRDLDASLRRRFLVLVSYHFHRHWGPPNKDPPANLDRYRL